MPEERIPKLIIEAIRYSNQKHWSPKKKSFSSLEKIRVIYIDLEMLNPKHGNQNALPPTTFKGKSFKSKNYFWVKNY